MGYGITDRIASWISSHGWLSFLAATTLYFILFLFIEPRGWLAWLLIAPVLSWISVCILLVIGAIEFVIWNIAHMPEITKSMFKERNKKKVARCLGIAALICIVGVSIFVYESYQRRKEIGTYLCVSYDRHDRAMLHLKPDCGESVKELVRASVFYNSAFRSKEQWFMRLNHRSNQPVVFCAKCINAEQMDTLVSRTLYMRNLKDKDLLQDITEQLREWQEEVEKADRLEFL